MPLVAKVSLPGIGSRIIALSVDKRLLDRKSTRLNSSHLVISYAVFCLKQIIAYLDLFLVLMGRVIEVIVTLGLEEEMARLTRGHGNQQAEQCRHHRIDEQHYIGDQEAR